MVVSKIFAGILGLAVAVGLHPAAYAAGEHAVLRMYVNSGNAGTVQLKPGVYVTVDHTTINCPEETCTLALSAMQSIESADSQGEWAIVALVDGKVVDGAAPYQGMEPIASYLTGSWQGSVSVEKGSHAVVFAIYCQISALLNQWSDSVIILTP